MTDFFRINMPYGMQRNDKGEWMFFNREYMPLGNISRDHEVMKEHAPHYYCRYSNMNDKLLESLAESNSIDRNEQGEITRIWFYNDNTTPACMTVDNELWNKYSSKLKALCALRRA